MVDADELRRRTECFINKKRKYAWKYIKYCIKKTSRQGMFSTIFNKEEVEDFIPVLEALGYKIILNKNSSSEKYAVSWKYPLSYWEKEEFEKE